MDVFKQKQLGTLLSIWIIYVCLDSVFGEQMKKLRNVRDMLAGDSVDATTAELFFMYHNCSSTDGIDLYKDCYKHCSNANDCLGLAQIKPNCYICKNESLTNEKLDSTHRVPERLISSFQLWTDHLHTIQEMYVQSASPVSVNECTSNSCHNGGNCVDGIAHISCNCLPGYTGSRCQGDIDECYSNPCANEGTCVDGVNSYTCQCINGWTGEHCEGDVNECISNPCANGGTCEDAVNFYTCQCVAGWSGVNCDVDIDECNSSPCANGGHCTHGVNSYACECLDGWTGEHCDVDIEECDSNPCQNGGSCVDGVNSYTCQCVDGWTGEHCEIDFEECGSSPCANGGACVEGVNSYTCQCVEGWTDIHCDVDIEECGSSPCENGGICSDGVNSYTCNCVGGWSGQHCDVIWTDWSGSQYFISSERKSWADSKAACLQIGGTLAIIDAVTDANQIGNVIGQETYYWIGLREGSTSCSCDAACDSCRQSWIWDDGSRTLLLSYWSVGHPVDGRPCGALDSNSQTVFSANCVNPYNFICRR